MRSVDESTTRCMMPRVGISLLLRVQRTSSFDTFQAGGITAEQHGTAAHHNRVGMEEPVHAVGLALGDDRREDSNL